MLKFDKKTWTIVGLGGVVAVVTAALVVQWKHAALGRQVSRNVTRFLTDHGAQLRDGVLSGGVVSVPMKQNAAINATIVQMLNAVADQLDRGGAAEGGESDDDDLKNPGYNSQRQAPPKSDNKPSPVAKRKSKRDGCQSPSEVPDDGGYGAMNGKKGGGSGSGDFSYNPNEFAPVRGPGGNKPPKNVDLFADDGDVGPVDADDGKGDFQ